MITGGTKTSTAAAVLNRLIDPTTDDLSPEAARSLLGLDFHQEDQQRMAELSRKAQEGLLSPEERSQLDDYLRIADFLAILQSKARRSLDRVRRAS